MASLAPVLEIVQFAVLRYVVDVAGGKNHNGACNWMGLTVVGPALRIRGRAFAAIT